MAPSDVFRSLTSANSRLGFYTKATHDRIPENPGCYAWFLPLWLYRDDLNDLVRLVSSLLDFEPDPDQQADVDFNWQSVELHVRHATRLAPAADTARAAWDSLLANPDARKAVQQTLLEASVLMPPLYVGRTNNLKQRYLQHAQERKSKRNDFHSRFAAYASHLELKLSVADLLYVCIQTPLNIRAVLDESAEGELNLLIEQMLMRFCRPPFSVR